MQVSRARRVLRVSSLLAVAIATAAGAATAGAGAKSRPDVILYVVDTLRADSLGCYGARGIRTPAFDRLAAEGARFPRAYAASSWTRTSVASLVTGLDPIAHGVHGRDDLLGPTIPVLTDGFRAAGYTTAFLVTNPNVGSAFGFGRAFDELLEPYARRAPGVVDSSELAVRSAEATRLALAWLARTPRPRFLAVLVIDPHEPYQPQDPPRALFAGCDRAAADGSLAGIARAACGGDADFEAIRALYRATVEDTDASFGALVESLRAAGTLDDTVVAVTADHGQELWDHGNHGHGRTLFEESIRVPLVIRYPPRVSPGQVLGRLARGVDVLPTLLDLARIGVPAVDGHSLAAALEGTPGRGQSVGSADDVAYASLDFEGRSLLAVIGYPWKLIRDRVDGGEVFGDLAVDPAGRMRWVPRTSTPDVRVAHERLVALAERYLAREPAPRTRVPAGAVEPAIRDRLRALGYAQ